MFHVWMRCRLLTLSRTGTGTVLEDFKEFTLVHSLSLSLCLFKVCLRARQFAGDLYKPHMLAASKHTIWDQVENHALALISMDVSASVSS